MKKKYIYTILVLFFALAFWLVENFYVVESYESAHETGGRRSRNVELLYPNSTTGDVIHHEYYSLSYHERFEQAEWVAYELNKGHLTYDNRKRPYFIEDPLVQTKSADWRNYRGSGYDRGHLCPAGDMRFSESAYNQTFYTSNISPQENAFNAGIWNRLEQKIRYWTKNNNSLFVVTGGVLDEGLPVIGDEDVAVPKYFYKIVAKGTEDNLQVLAFLMPHKDSNRPLEHFLVPVDSLEKLTGIDFFIQLPDEQEELIESEVVTKGWKF